MQIEVFSDVCPWCCIGKRRLEQALSNFPQADAVTVTYRSFQLDPAAPERDELLRLAVEIGLEESASAAVLDGGGFAAEVERDIATARAFGATGVPFFVFDRRYAISGAQETAVFSQALDSAWSAAPPVVAVDSGESCAGEGCVVHEH